MFRALLAGPQEVLHKPEARASNQYSAPIHYTNNTINNVNIANRSSEYTKPQ
jgi:hypothetical protein